MALVYKKTISIVLSFFLVISLIPGAKAAAAGGAGGGVRMQADSPPPVVSLPDIRDIRTAKESLTPAERKICPGLLALIKPAFVPEGTTREQLVRQYQSGGQLSRGSSAMTPDALLAYVYISLNAGATLKELGSFQSLITDSAPECGLAVARVAVERLPELASLPAVKSIEVVTSPECSYSGSVTSQSDALLGADVTRALGGIDGSGIKIGVISDGVNNRFSSIASGDLPGNLIVLRNAQGGDEGTAMLELAHDLAPGAQLYFHDCGDNKVQFMAAIDKLAAAGCDIICDDVKWFSEPFFEDGNVADHITRLLATKNIVYCTSGGNLAKRHYQGAYYAGQGGYHDFSRGKDAINPYLYLKIPNGGTAEIWLQWDEPFGGASNDYDLYLYNIKNGTIAAQSTYSQMGAQNPYEYVTYKNSGADADYAVFVVPFNASIAAKNLEIVIGTGGNASVYANNTTAADSIVGHAAVPGVITCGAVNRLTPNVMESFSSQGPATMLSGARKKPDICGVDGVRITGAGGFGGAAKEFTGTSAAVPQIAAIAALIWQKHPGLTAAQVKARICGYAQDLGDAGHDSKYGYGRANANTAALGGAVLSSPASLRQTGAESSSVTLAWQAVPYADGYEVWRATSQAGTYSLAATTASASAANGGLTTNRAYYYKVRAFWSAAKKYYGGFSSVIMAKPVPGATVLKASALSYSSIRLTWASVAGATRYELYRSTSPWSGYSRIRTTISKGFTDTGRLTGRTYYYKARAYRLVSGKKVYGSYSNTVSIATKIGSPATIKAARVSKTSVKLSWGKVAGRTKYEVWRCATSANGTFTLVKTTTSTSFTNTGLTPGKSCWYKVRAYRVAGGKKVYGNFSSIITIVP